MPRGKTYWMIVDSYENFRITAGIDFTIQGLMTKQRRKAQRMEPGDRLVYYVNNRWLFCATATVTSKCSESHQIIWTSNGKPDDFPWRVNIKADVILNDDQFLDARQIGPRMEYLKRWPPEFWPLAFQGNLHILPKNDFDLLEGEMLKSARSNRKPRQEVSRNMRIR